MFHFILKKGAVIFIVKIFLWVPISQSFLQYIHLPHSYQQRVVHCLLHSLENGSCCASSWATCWNRTVEAPHRNDWRLFLNRFNDFILSQIKVNVAPHTPEPCCWTATKGFEGRVYHSVSAKHHFQSQNVNRLVHKIGNLQKSECVLFSVACHRKFPACPPRFAVRRSSATLQQREEKRFHGDAEGRCCCCVLLATKKRRQTNADFASRGRRVPLEGIEFKRRWNIGIVRNIFIGYQWGIKKISPFLPEDRLEKCLLF